MSANLDAHTLYMIEAWFHGKREDHLRTARNAIAESESLQKKYPGNNGDRKLVDYISRWIFEMTGKVVI